MADVYTGDDQDDDQNAFVTDAHYDLLNGISSPCTCGKSMNPWKLESYYGWFIA